MSIRIHETYFGESLVSGKMATVVKLDVVSDCSNGGVGEDGVVAILESASPRFHDCWSFWPSCERFELVFRPKDVSFGRTFL